MTACTIYEAATGRVLRTVSGSADLALSQLADGELAYPAELPLIGCRINLETGEPEEFVPASPMPSHEWSTEERRFVPKDSALRRDAAALRIRDLESRQARALREHLLGIGDAADLQQRLQAIDDEIATLRADLSAGS